VAYIKITPIMRKEKHIEYFVLGNVNNFLGEGGFRLDGGCLIIQIVLEHSLV